MSQGPAHFPGCVQCISLAASLAIHALAAVMLIQPFVQAPSSAGGDIKIMLHSPADRPGVSKTGDAQDSPLPLRQETAQELSSDQSTIFSRQDSEKPAPPDESSVAARHKSPVKRARHKTHAQPDPSSRHPQASAEQKEARPSSDLSMADGQAHGPVGSAGSAHGNIPTASFGGKAGPDFIRFAAPAYPARARRMGISGVVLLELHLDESGRLLNVRVLQSPSSMLSEAALTAVRKSSFRPYMERGRPSSCKTSLPVRFMLE
ncbi:MAG: energy transducer TonB [Mailhella sp.]|nr:energy transducer TonB [Mailhella sp.]